MKVKKGKKIQTTEIKITKKKNTWFLKMLRLITKKMPKKNYVIIN